jgi:tetratricopeptide (TPR) repeat protein
MKRAIFAGMLALALCGSGLMAQKGKDKGAPAPAQQGQAAAQPKGPMPKSKGEQDAVVALINAQGKADEVITAAENLLSKYADTEFKDAALFMEAQAYQAKGDAAKAQVYAEQALAAKPSNFQASLMLADLINRSTRENDLDKEEKLTRADKYAKDSITAINAAEKPNPQISDKDWDDAKKDMVSQAHDALGMSALTRKNYDGAVTEFKAAVDGAAHPEPAYEVRLASAYNNAKKYDEAIATAQKVMDEAQTPTQIKQVAQSIRAEATVAKQKKAAGGGNPTAPPQVEIKK